MRRKILLVLLLALAGTAFYIYFSFFTSTTRFVGNSKLLYIKSSEATPEAVMRSLQNDSLVSSLANFKLLAKQRGYFSSVKPGRYRIKTGTSLYQLVNQLRGGQQEPVNLVINKVRLPQDLARLLDKQLETDSASAYEALLGADSSLASSKLYKIIPNTYSVLWTQPVEKVVARLNADYDKWWNQQNRQQKAKDLGFTPSEIYTIASIVEEETNKPKDKPLVASVYLNRLRLGMPLQADPTIRFALKNFVMNRILYTHLKTPSAYNTYLNGGLPPGAICTPSPATIDAVLDAPKTDYIFFVADADLRGGSTFTTNLTDHSRAARVYQDSLTAFLKRKALKAKAAKDSLAAAK
ncbi:MAG: endolytic transglycosylase MltG [Bacteroidetes bacterium]|nr:MAG: endolytic transglycosylase MltG [Bacteroidota bacterium]